VIALIEPMPRRKQAVSHYLISMLINASPTLATSNHMQS